MRTTATRLLLAISALVVYSRHATAVDIGVRAQEVLKKNCIACHGAAKMSGLDLRTRESILKGGERGTALTPGEPDESPLYLFAAHEEKPSMPPGKKLSDEDLKVLREWIAAGAPLESAAGSNSNASAGVDPDLLKLEERPITSEERKYWAFQRPKRVAPPARGNPVDAFLRAAMKSRGLKPSPPADRRTLIRRAFLDVLGLPPKPEDVESFVKDKSPDAWVKVVDQLLASPHYGERWARHWLDLVRYADSDGFEFDRDRPGAWRYRDWVVNSLNSDMPYDQFVKQQLAGDEIAPASPEAMIATGYLRLGPSSGGGGERGRQESLDDIIGTTSLTFLGLTVSCARCHNHKFDPIPQKDYYRMQAVFYPIRPVAHALVPKDVVAAHEAETARIKKLQAPLQKAKAGLEEPYRRRLIEEAVSKLPEYMQVAWKTPLDKRTDGQKLTVQQIEKTLTNDSLAMKITDQHIAALMTAEEKQRYESLAGRIEELEKQKPAPYASAMSIGEAGRQPVPSYFLHRGSLETKGSAMKPGVLSVVNESEYEFPTPPESAQSSWRRRGLAEWIGSAENPLTARVMVNRIWQHHFGEGIVRTPGNFGQLGERPSHPELLDWLAVEFVERGWSIKAMSRLMMLSETYQMASDDIQANVALDPENGYWWRMPRMRLEAEAIRDLILAAAGTLDRTLGGPCVFPYISPDLFQSSTKRTWPGKSDDDSSTWRRSLYVYSKRSIRYPMFEAYDQPNLVNSCDRRNRSTTAPQALLLMNNSFMTTQAKHFAQRLRNEAGENTAAQVDRGFHLAFGRAPSARELRDAREYLSGTPERLESFCLALFNSNELVYRQ